MLPGPQSSNATATESSVLLTYFPVQNRTTSIKSHLTSSKMAKTLVKIKSQVIESRDTRGQYSDFACSPRMPPTPPPPGPLHDAHSSSTCVFILSLFLGSSQAKPSQLLSENKYPWCVPPSLRSNNSWGMHCSLRVVAYLSIDRIECPTPRKLNLKCKVPVNQVNEGMKTQAIHPSWATRSLH